MLLGRRLLEQDHDAAVSALGLAADELDALGVAHLASRARELSGDREPA
jgi:hypothetical protein